MLKIALTGLGNIGRMHLEQWDKMDECEVVGITGRNQEKAKRMAEEFNTTFFPDLQNLLNSVEVDAVDICLPTFLHYQSAKEAAESGKHVVCEKPLGLNVKESKEIVDLCKRQNVQLYVGHTLRFFPEYVNAHEQIKSGAIGKTGVVRLSRGTPFPGKDGSWYADSDKSGGVVYDLGIHDFDWLIWTFGDVKRVMAKQVKNDAGERVDYTLVTLRMGNGTVAHVELSWAKTELETSFEIAGEKGMLVNTSQDSQPLIVQAEEDDGEESYLPESLVGDPPLYAQLKHFKNCILHGEEPIITGDDAFKAVKTAAAVNQSIKKNQPVEIGGTNG
ncbi:MAG TPA: Gfo/Idh/MocA family oxidoreductase [Lentibacillus sp.]|uniref:Gfo/Idh/MocA family protein n=1 Tax=Lentibacillus sp. TaxID=1925746 RepID=UPI002B4B822D|nr:Gfo/Idh/MocA family oxidoreductase [Lentibacillus sp.]HLR62139.1 Gfo/Idh/MocA family oxidoreductase [Lentibacillus sp.]